MNIVAPLIRSGPSDQATGQDRRWQLAAAQTRGVHHEPEQECQDAYRLAMVSPELLIIAIADGAGSAKQSLIGASLAVNQATDHLSTKLAGLSEPPSAIDLEDMLRAAMASAKRAVGAKADDRQLTAHDLASTLILLIVGSEFVAAAQIGDGATVIADEAGQLTALTLPPVGKYVNEVTFLTSATGLQSMQFKYWDGCAARLAAFSDGLQFLCLTWPERVPYERFFGPLFEFISATTNASQAGSDLAQFLSSEKVQNKTDDDLTLVLVSTTKCAHGN